MTTPRLGTFGAFGRGATPAEANEVEALGYGAIWVGGSPDHVPIQVRTGTATLIPAVTETRRATGPAEATDEGTLR